MDVLFRIRAGKDGLKKAGIICVSALFRPVPAVAKTGTVKNAGHFRRSLRKLLSFYILECHACIYNLLIVYKSVLQVENVEVFHNVWHHIRYSHGLRL